MNNRFHNLLTEELIQREMQSRIDRDELLLLIGERFRSESGFEIGKAYRVKPGGRLANRVMRLSYIVVGTPTVLRFAVPAWPIASGPLHNGKRWNSKHERIILSALDPEPVDV